MCETNPGRSAGRQVNAIEGAAISASLLCLVHCLALPLLLLLMPGALGLWVRSPAFHYAALLLLVPLALASFWIGYRRHRRLCPILLGTTGVAGVGLALLPVIGEQAETSLTVAGSLLLVVGHTQNWRLRMATGRPHGS